MKTREWCSAEMTRAMWGVCMTTPPHCLPSLVENTALRASSRFGNDVARLYKLGTLASAEMGEYFFGTDTGFRGT